MTASTPHFLLFSQTSRVHADSDPHIGRWQFVLEAIDGSSKLEVSDDEPDCLDERLELLAVIRGLEALDQPSQVTLVTSSRYVTRGLNYGLVQWRKNDWTWEQSGQRTAVRNDDLWRRIDGALRYHSVRCRWWRLDAPHPTRHSLVPQSPIRVWKRFGARAATWLRRRRKGGSATVPTRKEIRHDASRGIDQHPRRPHVNFGSAQGSRATLKMQSPSS